MSSQARRRMRQQQASQTKLSSLKSPSLLATMMANFIPKKAEPVQVRTRRDTKIVGDAPEINDYLPDRSYHSCWDSLESFTRYVSGLDKGKAWNKCGWDSDPDFYGSGSMEETLKLAKEGWIEGAAQIERTRSRVKGMRPQAPRLVKYELAGSVPNVPRAVAGNIFNMKAIDLAKSRKRPCMTLISNMSCLGHVDKDVISNRAAVVAALIDEIESAGFACEVISTALSKGDGEFRVGTSVRVKNSNQPVDLYRLAFALGHSSMFRRMVFADRGSESICKAGVGYGMGRSQGFEEFSDLAEKAVYVLPSANLCGDKFDTEDNAATVGVAYMVDQLRMQGCPAFPKLEGELDKEREERLTNSMFW